MPHAHKITERQRAILVVSPKKGDTARAADQLSTALAASENFHLTHIRSLKNLQKAVAETDLVWLHDTFFTGSMAAFFFARRRRKPILVTRHRGPARGNAKRGKFVAALLDQLTAKIMLKGAKQATFTSDSVAEHYYRRLPFAAPVKIIPNGVDLAVFRPVSIEKRRFLRDHFTLRDATPVLLFVGAFTPENGLPAIRHLAPLLPDWHFWLAGGNVDGRDPIDPEAWFLPNVQVFRNRAQASLAELYQSADRLILPGTGEEFPCAIQEAMACGLPVMVSPATLAGNRLAKPHLMTAPVEEGDPARTAALWADALIKQRPLLPLMHPKTELADIAHIFWQWPKIAGYYADMLRGLMRQI